MRVILFLLSLFLVLSLRGQPNCSTMKDNLACYNACQEVYKADMHRQGSYVSQKHFDLAIEKCPTFAYAYFEKSVAYLKRGYFIEWKKLIDKAIELEPKKYLFYRGWCQFTFLHNYKETISDLNKLSELYTTPFFGFGQNGDYDLRVVLALSYKLTNRKEKAIEIIETAMADKDYYIGLYDYLHLGVLYLETNKLNKAIAAFKKQIKENDLAEVRFYLGKTYSLKNKMLESRKELEMALSLYDSGRSMNSKYYEYIDEIYREEIMKFSNEIE